MASLLLRKVRLDGKEIIKLQCPKCKIWATIDDDQFHGRVSLDCPTESCDFHETHNLQICGEFLDGTMGQ